MVIDHLKLTPKMDNALTLTRMVTDRLILTLNTDP